MIHTLAGTSKASRAITTERDTVAVDETILQAIPATNVAEALAEFTLRHFIGGIRFFLRVLGSFRYSCHVADACHFYFTN